MEETHSACTGDVLQQYILADAMAFTPLPTFLRHLSVTNLGSALKYKHPALTDRNTDLAVHTHLLWLGDVSRKAAFLPMTAK
jgi:hypothetical protein